MDEFISNPVKGDKFEFVITPRELADDDNRDKFRQNRFEFDAFRSMVSKAGKGIVFTKQVKPNQNNNAGVAQDLDEDTKIRIAHRLAFYHAVFQNCVSYFNYADKRLIRQAGMKLSKKAISTLSSSFDCLSNAISVLNPKFFKDVNDVDKVVQGLFVQFFQAMSKVQESYNNFGAKDGFFECETFFGSLSTEKFFDFFKQIGEDRSVSIQDMGERFNAYAVIGEGGFQKNFPKLQSLCSGNDGANLLKKGVTEDAKIVYTDKDFDNAKSALSSIKEIMSSNSDFLSRDSLISRGSGEFTKKFLDKYQFYNPMKARELYKRFDEASRQIETYLKELEQIDDSHKIYKIVNGRREVDKEKENQRKKILDIKMGDMDLRKYIKGVRKVFFAYKFMAIRIMGQYDLPKSETRENKVQQVKDKIRRTYNANNNIVNENNEEGKDKEFLLKMMDNLDEENLEKFEKYVAKNENEFDKNKLAKMANVLRAADANEIAKTMSGGIDMKTFIDKTFEMYHGVSNIKYEQREIIKINNVEYELDRQIKKIKNIEDINDTKQIEITNDGKVKVNNLKYEITVKDKELKKVANAVKIVNPVDNKNGKITFGPSSNVWFESLRNKKFEVDEDGVTIVDVTEIKFGESIIYQKKEKDDKDPSKPFAWKIIKEFLTIDEKTYEIENKKDENENDKKFVTIDGTKHEVQIAKNSIKIIGEGENGREAQKSSEVSYKEYEGNKISTINIDGKKYDIAFAKSDDELNNAEGRITTLDAKNLVVNTDDGKVVLNRNRYYIQDMVSPSPFWTNKRAGDLLSDQELIKEVMDKKDKVYSTKEIMSMSSPEKMLYFRADDKVANGTFDPTINGLYLKEVLPDPKDRLFLSKLSTESRSKFVDSYFTLVKDKASLGTSELVFVKTFVKKMIDVINQNPNQAFEQNDFVELAKKYSEEMKKLNLVKIDKAFDPDKNVKIKDNEKNDIYKLLATIFSDESHWFAKAINYLSLGSICGSVGATVLATAIVEACAHLGKESVKTFGQQAINFASKLVTNLIKDSKIWGSCIGIGAVLLINFIATKIYLKATSKETAHKKLSQEAKNLVDSVFNRNNGDNGGGAGNLILVQLVG